RPEGNGSTQHLMQMTGRRAARESFLAPNNCTTSSRVSRAKAGCACGCGEAAKEERVEGIDYWRLF
ncbi:hypothetical protein TGP89_420300, partial [Toxoplasma gondii p89]